MNTPGHVLLFSLRKYLGSTVRYILLIVLFTNPAFGDDTDLESPSYAPPPPAPSVKPETPEERPVTRPTPKSSHKKRSGRKTEELPWEKHSFSARTDGSRMEAEYGDYRFFRYKTNFLFGVDIFQGAALLVGGQLGYAPFSGKPMYFGPEASFSLFNSSSILMLMLGGWYELRLYGAPRLSLNIGAVGGPAFVGSANEAAQMEAAAFLDACIVQEVNDLVSVRGQFRPGLIGNYFAFQMNFNVSFRFL